MFFAAGDIRTKLIRQLTTAAADGTVAALLAEKYIMQKERGNKVWLQYILSLIVHGAISLKST